MQFGKFYKYKKYYFIGIGGVSMSALAKFLLKKGCRNNEYTFVKQQPF